ncbi:hypothetical protein ACWCP6_09760 [Streptomyces sp. NPDC002004]
MSEHERNEQHDEEQHVGNAPVNHGPDGLDGLHGPDGQGGPGDPAGPHGLDGLDGLGGDESALRRMLHQAVQDLEPGNGTLEHLRRAVPARRARKRQAVVGMAAAALFFGTAVPALVHVSHSGGSSDDRTSMAGQAQDAQGGTTQGKGPDGGEKGEQQPSSRSTAKGKDDTKDRKGGKERGTGGGATGGPDTSSTGAPSSPPCTAADLGNATGSVNAPDGEGKVYGSFRITNVSGGSCTIDGPGVVNASAQGAADQTKVSVVDHTAGDAATQLPDPSQEVSQLVLAPGKAYEVRFAWVPSETCPTDGGAGGTDPTPAPSPSEGTTDSGGSTDQGGTTTQLAEDGAPADGSVLVSHVAEGGTPAASTTVGNACAGTVYRTGVLPAS